MKEDNIKVGFVNDTTLLPRILHSVVADAVPAFGLLSVLSRFYVCICFNVLFCHIAQAMLVHHTGAILNLPPHEKIFMLTVSPNGHNPNSLRLIKPIKNIEYWHMESGVARIFTTFAGIFYSIAHILPPLAWRLQGHSPIYDFLGLLGKHYLS